MKSPPASGTPNEVPNFWESAVSVYALFLTYRGLSSLACSALAGGIAFRICWRVFRRPVATKRLMCYTLPGLVGIVAACWAMGPAREKIRTRSLPPARSGAPNVLFIVLDTVRAESLSLHGYRRQTSPFLSELAEKGVRFAQARSTASWTLPSHASMFTGRWPHELSTRLDRPLDATYPTLAEFLRDHGYDTGGFVANTFFCSRWFGLSRGFLHYEDISVDPGEILRSSGLGRALSGKFCRTLRDRPTAYLERKDAATINDEVLTWLAGRPAGHPFFAFLNFYDVHDPYLTPADEVRHFGAVPTSERELEVLRDWHRRSRGTLNSRDIELAHDSYDDCITYLDQELRRLFLHLESKGLMENTLVIITSDHGEEFGEHGMFGHGQHIYSQVVHVPLMILGPGRVLRERTVTAPVSLRDLPATVADIVGLAGDSPFPGRSLGRHWAERGSATGQPDDFVVSEVTDDDGKFREGPPSRAFVEERKVYIRGGDGREELYDLDNDPKERHDLSGDPSVAPILERLGHRADEFEGVRGPEPGEPRTPSSR